MSWAVNNVAGSLAGTQNAARVVKRDVEKRKPAPNRRADADAYDHVAEATEVEQAEAVRSLKDNSQEEAHEDRREHGTDHALPAHDERAPDQPLQQTVYTNNAAIRTAALRSSRSLDLRG
tara:strand:+ start:376 stop:735 length:360 start_codon:yes stop_codon:yes gene_type:complete